MAEIIYLDNYRKDTYVPIKPIYESVVCSANGVQIRSPEDYSYVRICDRNAKEVLRLEAWEFQTNPEEKLGAIIQYLEML